MCKEYSKRIENNKLKKQEEKVINYFENAQKHKIIYFPIHKYFEYLAFKRDKTKGSKGNYDFALSTD